MKKILCLIGLYALLTPVFSQEKISIIPQPVEIKTGEGYFALNPSSSISLSSADAELKQTWANMHLQPYPGLQDLRCL